MSFSIVSMVKKQGSPKLLLPFNCSGSAPASLILKILTGMCFLIAHSINFIMSYAKKMMSISSNRMSVHYSRFWSFHMLGLHVF